MQGVICGVRTMGSADTVASKVMDQCKRYVPKRVTEARNNLRTVTIPAATAAAGIGGKTSRVASRGYLWWQP